MGVTDFPNQASSGGTVTEHGVTTITGAGTVTTSLDAVTGVNVSFASVPGTASSDASIVQGTAHTSAAGAATFIVRLYDGTGTAGTAAKAVAWTAFGTKE